MGVGDNALTVDKQRHRILGQIIRVHPAVTLIVQKIAGAKPGDPLSRLRLNIDKAAFRGLLRLGGVYGQKRTDRL